MQIKTALRTARITIRDQQKDDRDFCAEMWLDPENGKYLSDPTAESADPEYMDALKTLVDDPSGYYLIIEADGKRIGSCCAFPDENGVYDIGYCLHKTFWRQGYGYETLKLLISWIERLGGRKITAEVADANAASVALLRKCGFTAQKKTSFAKYHTDIRFDSHVYALQSPEKHK